MIADTPENTGRWQLQPWHVKLCRWLMWRPLFALTGVVRISWWMIRSRARLDVPTAWGCHMAGADIKMRHWWTMDEVHAMVKDRVP